MPGLDGVGDVHDAANGEQGAEQYARGDPGGEGHHNGEHAQCNHDHAQDDEPAPNRSGFVHVVVLLGFLYWGFCFGHFAEARARGQSGPCARGGLRRAGARIVPGHELGEWARYAAWPARMTCGVCGVNTNAAGESHCGSVLEQGGEGVRGDAVWKKAGYAYGAGREKPRAAIGPGRERARLVLTG